MSANTSIEWTDHTFNPWWGCQKISPACQHCYAETWAKRTGYNTIWGVPDSERRFFEDKHWNDPLKWNGAASELPTRPRVFCASMADVFEDRYDLIKPRARLLQLIDDTPNLDWLLLTKRPENIEPLLRLASKGTYGPDWNLRDHMPNVWLGTTVENQEMADKRIPILLSIPAKVRFLSCEPLLGPVDLAYACFNGTDSFGTMPGIDWVIAGGESGPKARPMHPDWARSLRDQCAIASVPFLFKQWGEHYPHYPVGSTWISDQLDPGIKASIERGEVIGSTEEHMIRIGKKRAGRTLDGIEHNGFPKGVSP